MLNLCIVYSDDLCPLCKNQLCFDRVWGFYILLNDWVVLYTQLWWIYMISFLSRWRKKFWLSLAWKLALVCLSWLSKAPEPKSWFSFISNFCLIEMAEKSSGGRRSIAAFFSKRCLPPAGESSKPGETSPLPPLKSYSAANEERQLI